MSDVAQERGQGRDLSPAPRSFRGHEDPGLCHAIFCEQDEQEQRERREASRTSRAFHHLVCRSRNGRRSPARPLTALLCTNQYDGKELKGENAERNECFPRVIPVPKDLEAVLSWWWREGYDASVRNIRGLVCLGFLWACTARPPASSAPGASAGHSLPSGSSSVAVIEVPPAEPPVVRSPLQLLIDTPVPRQAYEVRQQMVSVEGGAEGYIDDTSGLRVLATLNEVREIAGPERLQKICVARDGKTTFATSSDSGSTKFWRAERFDGPLTLLGDNSLEVSGLGVQSRPGWIVQSPAALLAVDCDSGTVERIGAPARRLNYGVWGQTIQLLNAGNGQTPERSFLRTKAAPRFRELPASNYRVREDGLLQIEKPRRTAKEKPTTLCRFLLDQEGNQLPCGTPLGPYASGPQNQIFVRPDLESARLYAPDRAVVAGERGLFRLELSFESSERLGPESLGHCTPLLPHAPVFACDGDPSSDLVVSVDPSGAIREELRRRGLPGPGIGQREQARFDVADDGGLAVGGDCEGNLANAACVRDRRGVWRTVLFSNVLVKALERTAPATRLVPTAGGDLYVGTGTLEGSTRGPLGLPGEPRLLLFHASEGGPSQISKLPVWILQALTALAESSLSSGRDRTGVSLIDARRFRVWPLRRKHPAIGTPEVCRVDIALEGQIETDCRQGRVFSVGRSGLLQRKRDELYETLDGGGSWVRLALPKGFDSEEIACTAVGCRIGPFWRAGWRTRTAP